MTSREILDLAMSAEVLVRRGARDAAQVVGQVEHEVHAAEDLLGRLGGCCLSERGRHELMDELTTLQAVHVVLARCRLGAGREPGGG